MAPESTLLNDIYEITPVSGGHWGGPARVATVRKRLTEANPNTFTVHAGDLFSPSALGERSASYPVQGDPGGGRLLESILPPMTGGVIVASSGAKTVKEYLQELPEDRREVVSRVRDKILENLPEGFEETMNWGMISYEVPLSRYPDTYNKKPLMYMALAAQKNHYGVYSSGVHMDPLGESWLKEEFARAGKKLDMGKSCIRFRRLENLPLEVVGKIAAAQTVDVFIEIYEAAKGK